MTASLETLVAAAYVFATSVSIPRPGPEGLITDHELIGLAAAQAASGICSDRQLFGRDRSAAARLVSARARPDAIQLPAPAPGAVDCHRAAQRRRVARRT